MYVLEYDKGITDSEVLEKSNQEGRILITKDKDFGELIYRLQKRVSGIILLRFSNKKRHLQWPRLKELISLKKVSDNLSLEDYYNNIDMKKVMELESCLELLDNFVK